MRRSSLAVLVLLAGCAAEVSGVDDESITEDVVEGEAPVEASAQALAGSSVPVIVALGDAAIDGVDDRAYTRHGFVFRSALRTTRANGIVENHANASISFRVVMTEGCRNVSTGATTTQRGEATVTVQPGAEHVLETRCGSGTTPFTTVVTWDNINTSATDIGYSESFNSIMSIGIGSSASQPNVEAFGRNQLRGVNKFRSTWGAIEVTNFGSSPALINFLVQRTTCSGSGLQEKFVSNVTVQPGGVVTSTKGCPAGQTVVSSYGIFGQQP